MKHAIYTEKTECRDCYKCVRECPVKAIRVKDSRAMIQHDRCIFCGRCVHVCPARAKRVRRDLPRAQQLLSLKERVFLSLAPSFPSFFTIPTAQLIRLFERLGFTGVSETAIGADIVTGLQNQQLADEGSRGGGGGQKISISSACPPVVELVRKYYPDMTAHLSPLHSPMGAHARFLRRHYGEDIGVVFVGPCIAKKHEADQYPDLIDVALTFDEAAEWLESDGAEVRDPGTECEVDGPEERGEKGAGNRAGSEPAGLSSAFVPAEASAARVYPVEGGMRRAMEASNGAPLPVFAQSGIHSIRESLGRYRAAEADRRVFCELLACPGGCICGCGAAGDAPPAERYRRIVEFSTRRSLHGSVEPGTAGQDGKSSEGSRAPELRPEATLTLADCCRIYTKAPADDRALYSEEEVQEALRRLQKLHREDLKDCGGCGYNTCREFATAWLAGMAEKEMCVTEMRKLAQRKANALLRKIPLGIALVDNDEKIVECNAHFLSLFCNFEEEPSEEEVTRAYGADIKEFFDEPQLLRSVLSHRVRKEEILRTKDKVLETHCFSIQPGRLVGITLHDITSTSVKRSMVVRKAEEVIHKNLSSVQQIAGLLGENAAETEILLNQLIETFDPGNVPEEPS